MPEPLGSSAPPGRDLIRELPADATMEVVAKSPEHPADRSHRHEVERARLAHSQRLQWLWSGLGAVVISLVTLSCVGIALGSSDQDLRRHALSTLVAMVTAVLGFAAGRGTRSEGGADGG